jgi:hypothetical protein
MIKAALRPSVFLLCALIGTVSVWFTRSLRRVEVSKPRAAVPVNVSAESEAVYQSALDQKFAQDGVRLLVIQDVTTGCPAYEDPEIRSKIGPDTKSFVQIVSEGMHTAKTSTIENYLESNKSSERIAIHANVGSKYLLVGEKELAQVFRKGEFDRAWTRFYAKYPNSSGLIFLSKVGFNSDRTQAMLYAGRQCGGLCGSGSYLLLNKRNGKWFVEEDMGLWVS